MRHGPYSLRPSMLSKIHYCYRGAEYSLRFTRDAISHLVPTRPCQFILQDIFEFQHKQYLVIVDNYSDFYELDQLINTQSTTVVVLTKAHLAHHGIPVRFLTENGPKAKEV